jgi:polysaccharide pyruvyl transferase WcaK-like protein
MSDSRKFSRAKEKAATENGRVGDGLWILVLASGYLRTDLNSVNLGDAAQLENALEQLRTHLDNPRLVCVANSPKDQGIIRDVPVSHRAAGYIAGRARSQVWSSLVPRRVGSAVRALLLLWNARRSGRGKGLWLLSRPGREALEELIDADALYISGAGTLNDRYATTVGALWCVLMRAASLLGKPVVLSGQQIGPLRNRSARFLAAWGLRSAEFVGVREPASFDEARKLRIPENRLVLTGDDAWDLPSAPINKARRVLRSAGIPEAFIAANIRFDAATGWSHGDVGRFAHVLDRLGDKYELPIVFVRLLYGNNDDYQSARLIQSQMREHSFLIDEEMGGQLTKAVLSIARCAIGVSYHFCVFALSAGTPTVGIYRTEYMAHKFRGLTRLQPRTIRCIADPLFTPETVQSAMEDMLTDEAVGRHDSTNESHVRYEGNTQAAVNFLIGRLA